MFFNKRKQEEYVAPLDLLDVLPEPILFDKTQKEVLFTIGEQQVIKEDEKYFLANTMNFNCRKEITKQAANELGQICKFQCDNTKPKMYID